MNRNIDVEKAFSEGLGASEPMKESSSKKTKNKKKSKLESHSEVIFQLWAKNKSMRQIADHLKNNDCNCHRSTVWRFLKKSLSL